MKPIGREKIDPNPNCKCTTCVQAVKPNVPWMQSIPRFGVVDNHQRSVPELNPIRGSDNAPPSPTTVGHESNEMLQTQIKFNRQLMQQVNSLNAEKKALQAAFDQIKKESAYYKAKLGELSVECDQLKNKLGKGKPDAKADSDTNKENVNNSVQPDNTID